MCQHLDQASLVHARAATPDLREACSEAPVALRLTLPMQSAPWLPVQYRTWDMRLRGLAGLLSSGKMTSTELQLRMEGAANWRVRGLGLAVACRTGRRGVLAGERRAGTE